MRSIESRRVGNPPFIDPRDAGVSSGGLPGAVRSLVARLNNCLVVNAIKIVD